MSTLLSLDFPLAQFEPLFDLQTRPESGRAEWTPRTAISEHEQEITLELDLPGVRNEDLELQIEQDQLTIRGERKPSADLDNYRRVEPRYGVFTRTFALPESVNRDGITAQLEHGVLRVVLPQREEAKPRRIEVKS
ncbi:MAG: Hsp20/alpha crystallin family protein [Terriglobales bacterium]